MSDEKNKPQHTPGPWEPFELKEHRPGVEAKDFSVVVWGAEVEHEVGVQGRTREEAHANAHLIAAAPDLLGALERMVEAFGDNNGMAAKAARAAIAQARGEA